MSWGFCEICMFESALLPSRGFSKQEGRRGHREKCLLSQCAALKVAPIIFSHILLMRTWPHGNQFSKEAEQCYMTGQPSAWLLLY